MSEDQQNVADEQSTDTTLSADVAGAQEEKTVDQLLAEFDTTEPEKQETVNQEPAQTKLDPNQEQEIANRVREKIELENELDKTITDIKGDLDVDADYVRWTLDNMAQKDERVLKAFLARGTKPSAWNAIVEQVKSDMSAKYGKPTGTDKEKIASAVHSATQTSGTSRDVNIKKLSNEEFEMNKESLLAKALKG